MDKKHTTSQEEPLVAKKTPPILSVILRISIHLWIIFTLFYNKCIKTSKKPFLGQKWPNMARLLMSQSGLRGSKMIQNDQYNIFLAIWGHFGPIWTLLDHFRQNLIFCLKTEKCFLAEVIWSKKSSFVWNDPKESKWAQNDPKWPKVGHIGRLVHPTLY